MIAYTQNRTLSAEYVRKKIAEFLYEDNPTGDKTTLGTVSSQIIVKAEVQAVENQIFAGAAIIPYCFGDDCKVELFSNDGNRLQAGQAIAQITGPATQILGCERVMLNLLQRICGIATLTGMYVDKAESKIKILDTRKTTPGLRLFEKYAVTVGGGYNHRLDLSSGILIKDNHIQAVGSVTEAVNKIKKKNFRLPIELEVDNFEQITEGLHVGVDGFLLDNMNPDKTIKAVKMIRGFPGGTDLFIESSGGINLETLSGYLNTGIDAVSIGALTHSAKSTDIRLEFLD